MKKNESIELAELRTRFDEFLKREEERDTREVERDRLVREIYDMLRFTRMLGRVVKWVCLVGFGFYMLMKHGDASVLGRAFGK